MKKKTTFLGLMLSAAMLVSAMPPALAAEETVEAQSDAVLVSDIPEAYAAAAQTHFSDQLNPQAKAIYDLLVQKFTDGEMNDGVSDIDLSDADGVTEDDVKEYLAGNRTLYNDFTAAKDAFDLEHPEAWYIDCDYLSFRTAKDDNDGTMHAYVGIGRGDTYLVQGMSADEVDVKTKAKQVEDKVKEIAKKAEDVTLPNNQEVTIKDQIEAAHDLIVNSITYTFEDGVKYKRVYDDQDQYVEGVDYTDEETAKHYLRTPFALITHAGVCESYSRAFQMVMKEMGVPCVLLHGVQTSGTPENHMWTAVQVPKLAADDTAALMDGDPMEDPDYGWYVCDLTWDDPTTYEWLWDSETHEKIGYLPKQLVNGQDGGENNTYFMVGNDIVGGAWELSPYFSTKDMAFTYPQIEPVSYTANMLINNPNGLTVKYAETAQMDDIKASLWEVRYKGMSCLQASEKGYYFLCRLYSKHADGTMSQFDDWYYPEHALYMMGDDPNDLKPAGNVHFHDTSNWKEAQETQKYPEGEGALVMSFGHVDYIEFAITTKAPPVWNTAADLLIKGGYYSGDGSDILAETGMMYNKMGSYEAPPAVTKQVPTQTASVKTQGGSTRHVSVEFNDRLYDPDAADETRKAEGEYDTTSNYDDVIGQALQVVPFYQDSFGRPHQMSQNPTYQNFKVTYACGETETLQFTEDSDRHGEGQMNDGNNTPIYKFKDLTHEMSHTVDEWNGYTNCKCGVVKVEFDLTNSPMWFDDGKDYMFSLKGLIGRQSDKLPATWGWTFVIPYCPICYRSQGIDMNLWAQPKLMDGVEDMDLEKMVVKGIDGEKETLDELTDRMGGSATFRDGRMALVVEDMSQSAAQGELNEQLDDMAGTKSADILSRMVYDLNFARICSKIVVYPGQSVRLQVGFPAGFDASSIDKGIKFSAYHFTRCSAEGEANPLAVYGDANMTCEHQNEPGHKWGDDVLSVEPIHIEVTPYGLVLIVDRFSPFEIIAVPEDSETGMAIAEAELAEGTKTLIVQREGEGTVTKADGSKATGAAGMVDIDVDNSETFTITPEAGYQVGSVNLFGEEIMGTDKVSEADGSVNVTVDADETFDEDNPMLLVKFEAEAVNTQNEVLGVTAELPKVCTHAEKQYFQYAGDEIQVIEGDTAKLDATCTTDGIYYGTQCKECKQVLTEPVVIPATGHDFSKTVAEGKTATCTADGVTPKVQCSVCNAQSGGVVIPATGHSYGEYSTKPDSATCQGTTLEATCIRCNTVAEKSSEKGKVEHKYLHYVSDGNATCTTDGTETAQCEWCDQKDTRPQNGSATGHRNVGKDGICTDCNTYVCETEHQGLKVLEAKEATCEDPGLKEGLMCETCGKTITAQEVIPPKGHNWGEEDPETHTAQCQDCQAVKQGDHKPVEKKGKPATCTEEGLTDGQVCGTCGDVIEGHEQKPIPALGHEWDVQNPVWAWNAQDGISATITFKCSRKDCNETYVVQVDPQNIKEVVDTAPTCDTEGESHYSAEVDLNIAKEGVNGAIVYKGSSDSGKTTVPKLVHEFTTYELLSEATCSADRVDRAYCAHGCGATNDKVITGTKTEHNFTGYEVTKPATCTEKGVGTYTCSYGCGVVKTVDISPTGHNFVGSACQTCGQRTESDSLFHAATVDELQEKLNSPDLDKGDVIVLAPGEYDLNAVENEDGKISGGVMHINQGITLTSVEPEEGASLASAEDVTIKGSISVDTADVTIEGLTFSDPVSMAEGEPEACIGTVDDGSCANITVKDCVYTGAEDDGTAFVYIEGAQGVNVSGNTVTNADFVFRPGKGVAKSGGIKINGNTFDGVKMTMTEQAVVDGDSVDINGNRWGGGEEAPTLSQIVEGDYSGFFRFENYINREGQTVKSDVEMKIEFEQQGTNAVKMFIRGYTADGTPVSIEKLVAVDLKVSMDSDELAITGFTPTDNWTFVRYEDGRYLLHENGFNNNYGVMSYDKTGSSIELGTFSIGGYGSGKIKAEIPAGTEYNVQQRDETNSVVRSAKVTSAADEEGNIVGTNVIVAPNTKNLTVKIAFNNNVKDGKSAEDMDMSVTVKGGGYEKTGKVGSGNEDGVIYDADYSADAAELLFANIPAPGRYSVTVSGAGYRTFTKDIIIGDTDVTMSVWNNAMDESQTVIVGSEDAKDKYAVTFLAGDIVQDYKINLYDLSAVVAYFGKTGIDSASAKDYIKYDLNRDGAIDSKDVAMVLVSWDK